LEHYRCYQFYVPDTNGLCITSTAEFFPEYTKMPTLSSANLAADAAERLIHVLRNPSFPAPYKSLAPRQLEALTKLAEIFQTTTHEPLPGKLPRVAVPTTDKNHPVIQPYGESSTPPRVPHPPMQTRKMASEPTAIPNTYKAGPVPHGYPLCNHSIFSAMAVQRLVDNTVFATAQEVFACAVIDPTTGKSLTYDQRVRDKYG
jgi:hypothetical protein